MMGRLTVAACLIVLAALSMGAWREQASSSGSIYLQATPPAAASIGIGYFWYDTSTSTLKLATSLSPVTWTAIGPSGGGGGGLPAGAILLVASGSCPAGTVEDPSLAGKTLVGTTAANGDVGTTGGSDTFTPDGTVAAPTFTGTLASLTHSGANVTSTFTGSALGTHSHELPFQIVSGTSIRALPSATFGVGTSRAAVGGWTATANTTSAAVAKDQAISAGTPAGTVANTVTQPSAHSYTPQGSNSAPTFTGVAGENRSAFTRVIFCQAT